MRNEISVLLEKIPMAGEVRKKANEVSKVFEEIATLSEEINKEIDRAKNAGRYSVELKHYGQWNSYTEVINGITELYRTRHFSVSYSTYSTVPNFNVTISWEN